MRILKLGVIVLMAVSLVVIGQKNYTVVADTIAIEEAGFALSPAKIEARVNPGSNNFGLITLENKEGKNNSYAVRVRQVSGSAWFVLEKYEVELAAGEKVIIPVNYGIGSWEENNAEVWAIVKKKGDDKVVIEQVSRWLINIR